MKRIVLHPENLPIVPTQEVLPAVSRERLQPDFLRDRLAVQPVWQPEALVDPRVTIDTPVRAAAVLVPVVMHAECVTVLLTQRTAHLHDHAGQISFPGGSREPDDVDLIATALRESQEEVGLSADQVEVIGHLPTFMTGTGFSVVPVIGLVQAPLQLVPDSFEVAEVFEVPLHFLMNPAHHQRRAIPFMDGVRYTYAIPYPRQWALDAPESASSGSAENYFIWGVTAGILRNFYHLLAA